MASDQGKKRVAVIGGGSAGMSCAAALAQHPDKFSVILFEAAAHICGQAASIDIDESKHGASWLNDGVQGGSAIFRHTFGFFRRYGHEPQEVKLQASFGKRRDSFWTNVFPSHLVDELSQEIKKLGRVLKWIKYLLPILGLMPVKILLRLFRFSRDFSNKTVLPLLALPMYPVPSSERETEPEHFDELALCAQADDAKKLLGKHATWREKFILEGVRFYNDITVTHSDSKYFQSIFENRFQMALCADATTPSRKDQVLFATSEPQCRKDGWIGFQPMHFVHSFPSDPDKIEMGFDCTNYQHQFRSNIGEGNPPQEQDRHVFQTIFLNDQEKQLWMIDQIKEDKIIGKKWWHQWGHRWSHYLRVNMHEVACVSGIAAAYRLGATYDSDGFGEFAEDFFSKYLLLAHGVRYKPNKQSRCIGASL
ncbi:hypothetical protein PISL3812_05813 [Talaromyces islandicus]|uniref:Amine oxidase domain-containing protein n=1 Tax=Talaromyces islandicus TaxID=28573 RepID=A0A0U1LZQ5_TALIS|nr:hypothetical protein PISL3812_05813 [Talaromyces islandicus]